MSGVCDELWVCACVWYVCMSVWVLFVYGVCGTFGVCMWSVYMCVVCSMCGEWYVMSYVYCQWCVCFCVV